MSQHDFVTIDAFTGSQSPPHLLTATDERRDLKFVSTDNLVESSDQTIAAWAVGTGAATTFTIGKLPANCIVREVSVIVSGTAGTAATTIAVGITGTPNKYMAASSFTSTMNAAGVKTVTTVPIHETAKQTVIATFSAAWDAGAKALVAVRYIKIPVVPA